MDHTAMRSCRHGFGCLGHGRLGVWLPWSHVAMVWFPWLCTTMGLLPWPCMAMGLVSMASEGLVALAIYGHGFGCHGYVRPRVWYLLGIHLDHFQVV